MGFSLNATAQGTVVREGGSSLTAYGFVWAEHANPTLDDNVSVKGTGSFTGTFSKSVSGLPDFTTVYFAAYATNSQGTSYGAVLSGETMICLAAGTLISTAHGKKKIEAVKYNDSLAVWDFDKAIFNVAKPVWIVKPFKHTRYGLLRFSNGQTLKTVADGKGHRIFNLGEGKFTYSMGHDTPIGTKTFTEDKKIISLVGKEVVNRVTTFYNVITHTHMNVFANEILTSTGLNNLYPITDMKFVKNNRELRTKDEFDVSDELFRGLRLAEQPQSYARLADKIKFMEKHQKPLLPMTV